jgi:hypothetical protein
MGAPLIYEVLETPATASIVLVCCLSWLWINWRGIGTAQEADETLTIVASFLIEPCPQAMRT